MFSDFFSMKLLTLILISITSLPFVNGQRIYSNEYEINFIKEESGKVIFTIYNYCKDEKKCIDAAKIDAVKYVLFRGFSNNVKIYPIIREATAQEKYKIFFDDFFKKNGKYLQFIEYSEDISVDFLKVKNRKMKSAMNIIILRDNLIKEMENRKIIKKLDDGF